MPKSKVVLVRSKELESGADPSIKRFESMLCAGMSALNDCMMHIECWAKLAKNSGRIGIKPNCVAAPQMSSSVELVLALADLLRNAGKKAGDIVIWERQNAELKRAGFKPDVSGDGFRCYGTDTRGVGYGSKFHKLGKVGSLVTRIIENDCDHLINVPILRDHSLAGVSGAMKNYYGAVHNPNKYHDNNCDPYVAEVNALPVIKDKNILTVMDMTRMQYNGGPGYRSAYAVNLGSILISTDPVAIDAVGEKIINEQRSLHEMGSLADAGRHPKWLVTAQELGVGTADLSSIDLIEVNVD